MLFISSVGLGRLGIGDRLALASLISWANSAGIFLGLLVGLADRDRDLDTGSGLGERDRDLLTSAFGLGDPDRTDLGFGEPTSFIGDGDVFLTGEADLLLAAVDLLVGEADSNGDSGAALSRFSNTARRSAIISVVLPLARTSYFLARA